MSSLGAIPYRLRVGVTGHRVLPVDPALGEQVRCALRRARGSVPSSAATPLCMAVISPLAEGADRLVAREALDDQDAVLIVPLPLPVDDYINDFAADDSKRAFKGLLARAREVVLLPKAEAREDAYQNVADYLVEQCDILIALWDGHPARGQGGTAEVVALARERRLPLLWIETRAPFALHEEYGDGIARDSFRQLDLFNRGHVDATRLGDDVARRTAALGAAAARAGLDPDVARRFAAWNLPYLARADMLALRHQAVFTRASVAVFFLAAVSASTAAARQLFFPRWPQVDWLDVILPLAAVSILLMNRRRRLHERWSAYRLLAEWLRARLFLAMVGVAEDGGRGHPDSPSEGWLVRAFEEVWARRPGGEPAPDQVGPLKKVLTTAWLQGQIDYSARDEPALRPAAASNLIRRRRPVRRDAAGRGDPRPWRKRVRVDPGAPDGLDIPGDRSARSGRRPERHGGATRIRAPRAALRPHGARPGRGQAPSGDGARRGPTTYRRAPRGGPHAGRERRLVQHHAVPRHRVDPLTL